MRQNKILAIIAISMGGMFIGVHFFSQTRNTQALWLGIACFVIGISIFLFYYVKKKRKKGLHTIIETDYTLEHLKRDLANENYKDEHHPVTDCMG